MITIIAGKAIEIEGEAELWLRATTLQLRPMYARLDSRGEFSSVGPTSDSYGPLRHQNPVNDTWGHSIYDKVTQPTNVQHLYLRPKWTAASACRWRSSGDRATTATTPSPASRSDSASAVCTPSTDWNETSQSLVFFNPPLLCRGSKLELRATVPVGIFPGAWLALTSNGGDR